MTSAFDITAVLTCHSEGVLAGPSFVSFRRAIDHARGAGLAVEALIVLDRPSAATRRQFSDLGPEFRVIITDEGDPGLARNAAVDAAGGAFLGFLDGDDLWPSDWLTLAHQFCSHEPDKLVAHSECNVVFGAVRVIWWHADSRDPKFNVDYLRISNYWDAMSFASRQIYARYPFVKNELKRGFGHEDWHWNCVTIAAGIGHRPVPGTVHFKRRRKGSQMALCDAVGATVWKNPISSYSWRSMETESHRYDVASSP